MVTLWSLRCAATRRSILCGLSDEASSATHLGNSGYSLVSRMAMRIRAPLLPTPLATQCWRCDWSTAVDQLLGEAPVFPLSSYSRAVELLFVAWVNFLWLFLFLSRFIFFIFIIIFVLFTAIVVTIPPEHTCQSCRHRYEQEHARSESHRVRSRNSEDKQNSKTLHLFI